MAESSFLILVNISPDEWCYPIESRRQVIGRATDANIPVPQQFHHVSRRHAEVWRDKHGVCWIQDLNSRAGIQINGVWIERMRPARLDRHDRIWLGGLELEMVTLLPGATSLRQFTDSDEHDVQPDESLITAHWSAAPASTQCLLGRLTHAELEVVLCMGRGLIRDDEIGRQLFRSPHTVRTQVASIFDKLGLHSRPELLGWLKRANGDVHAANGPQ